MVDSFPFILLEKRTQKNLTVCKDIGQVLKLLNMSTSYACALRAFNFFAKRDFLRAAAFL